MRSTTRSRSTGKAELRNGSTVISAPSAKSRMKTWQLVTWPGPWGTPSISSEQAPQIPSRQSESKAIGRAAARDDQALVEHVEHLQERGLGVDVVDLVALEAALGRAGPSWRQTLQRELHL